MISASGKTNIAGFPGQFPHQAIKANLMPNLAELEMPLAFEFADGETFVPLLSYLCSSLYNQKDEWQSKTLRPIKGRQTHVSIGNCRGEVRAFRLGGGGGAVCSHGHSRSAFAPLGFLRPRRVGRHSVS